jgi:hypothetical protein
VSQEGRLLQENTETRIFSVKELTEKFPVLKTRGFQEYATLSPLFDAIFAQFVIITKVAIREKKLPYPELTDLSSIFSDRPAPRHIAYYLCVVKGKTVVLKPTWEDVVLMNPRDDRCWKIKEVVFSADKTIMPRFNAIFEQFLTCQNLDGLIKQAAKDLAREKTEYLAGDIRKFYNLDSVTPVA